MVIFSQQRGLFFYLQDHVLLEQKIDSLGYWPFYEELSSAGYGVYKYRDVENGIKFEILVINSDVPARLDKLKGIERLAFVFVVLLSITLLAGLVGVVIYYKKTRD